MLIINRKIKIQAGVNNYEFVAQKLKELTHSDQRFKYYETNICGHTAKCVFFDDVTIHEEDLQTLIEYLKTIKGVVSITY